MAVNFPDSPTNGDTFQAGGLQFTYNSTTNSWDSSSNDPTNVTSSDTAPSNPNAGDLWFNSSNLQLYVYYSDGSSSQWVKTNPSGSGATHAVAVQNTQPSNPSAGDLWFDTDNVVLYVYYTDGSSNQWVGVSQIGGSSGGGGASVTVSDTAPASPTAGDLWWNSTDLKLYVYYSDGSSNQWVQTNPSFDGAIVSISDTAPSSPIAGNMWFDSSDGALYVYYNDGSSSQWISVSGPAGPAGAAATTTYATIAARNAASPSAGDLAFVTANKALYLYDGTEWDRISAGSDESPVITTEPPTTHTLSPTGNTTSLSMTAVDPEGFPITYGIAYNTSDGSLPDQLAAATSIDQSTGTYTFTPTSNTSLGGTFKGRLSASDGVKFSTRSVNFNISFTNSIEYLMVAGGGAGGNGGSGGGGGGAGGLLTDTIDLGFNTTISVIVGTGGAGGISAYSSTGNAGSNSSITYDSTTIVAYGGGWGSSAGPSPYALAGGNGGSGGGAAQRNGPVAGGIGVYPGSTYVDAPRQGYDGGGITSGVSDVGGGGGGAGGIGATASSSSAGGAGGAGIQSSITGTALYYAGGGGGNGGTSGGAGGSNIGGAGGAGSSGNGFAGAPNTGSGGGGSGFSGSAGAGADGVVIFRTLVTASATTGSPTVTTDGDYTVYKFTGNGTITF